MAKNYSSSRTRRILGGLTIVLLLVAVFSLMTGVVSSGIRDTLDALLNLLGLKSDDAVDDRLVLIMGHIRIPRLVLGILVGGGLAISGTVMQGLFRNPMADPGLLGVSSGAALGAVTSIVLGVTYFNKLYNQLGPWLLPVMAFCGSFLSLLLVYRLAKFNNRVDIATMLLAGVAVNAITGSLIGLLSYIADDTQLRDLVFWSLGSLEITDWTQLGIATALILPGSIAMLFFSDALNANLLGENEARHLGIDIERVKLILILLVALVVGVAVALSGVIGFVGLIVPHLLRLLVGPDHRLLLPASTLFGASLLVLADIIARSMVAPAEIPIGIITALIGGPFFLWLLVRYQRRRSI